MTNNPKLKDDKPSDADIYDFLLPPGVNKEDVQDTVEIIQATQKRREPYPNTVTASKILQMLEPSGAQNVNEYLDLYMQQAAMTAANRIQELVESEDEKVATKNAHYVMDHIRGKAIQRSITAHAKVNVQDILD